MGGNLHEMAREHISGLSDQELSDYLAAGTELYEPEAVAFAREEFARRNIEPGQVARLATESGSGLWQSRRGWRNWRRGR